MYESCLITTAHFELKLEFKIVFNEWFKNFSFQTEKKTAVYTTKHIGNINYYA